MTGPAGVSVPDAAVIGGGVIGAACARAAAAHGLRVAVFDPGPEPGAATAASAGMLAAQIEPAEDEALLALCVRGRDRYPELAARLKDTTGQDIGLWHDGIASIAFAPEDAERLRNAAGAQRLAGLPCAWLEPAEVRERWPGAAPEALGALFASEDGAVDPAALARALRADAERLGAVWRRERVVEVVTAGTRAVGVRTEEARRPAGAVILAAGAWSARITGVPRPLFVEPVRGQMAAAPWPDGIAPAILYYGHRYVLPRGGRAVMGSTMEHAGFDAATTADGQAAIREGAARLIPALAGIPTVESWAGLRPITPDGRPIIGPEPELPGLFYATGHGRNGILLAALTGELVADLIVGGSTDVDLAPFAPTRFAQT